ncbi:dihydrolipoyllysine-residue succinyltransferase [Paenibacillus terrae]|uniref:Dihydrolipoyllysine-residue succinyltransferase component of 2-oxoglutarate dehydrogenase complex n=1 Tax=Paenibacillus terrae TaxID=159743 RepID=A0A4U2PZU2_9BACL|nr:2-oxoglutarate dehydrogenase complex dihydrolipoyllysine-residue succinyltransferase [Paenibacillus terrae]TKH44340.1 dihydrolipoyllysine-residue succinyltransferase [Paenibacillus terrae]
MSDILVPAMGESITEGTISKWLVKEGDSVGQGDVLLELETDKVNLEISAEEAGVVQKILRQEGETVVIGEAVGLIGSGSGTGNAEPSSAVEAAATQAPEASAVATSPASTAGVGKSAAEQAAQPIASNGDGNGQTASPSARKLARERGIDLEQVQGKDPLGRVFQEDVKTHSNSAHASRTASPAPAAPAANKSAAASPSQTEYSKPVERQRMSRRRATIAKRLVEAQQTAAMLTTFNEVDMTAILDVRKRRKDKFKEKHDVGLGFMSFFTKAVVGALKRFPTVNAEINGDDIVLKKYYDIGIAVSAKEGLVVPVVRDADRLGFAEIEKSIAELAGKARSNSLSLADLQGGTFTITNGGIFGSLLSTPILNTPQVGILGMHKIQLRPIAIDEERMENRPMMYIALSYDHRIIDGSEAVRFLVTVKELLEDPESLLLEG